MIFETLKFQRFVFCVKNCEDKNRENSKKTPRIQEDMIKPRGKSSKTFTKNKEIAVFWTGRTRKQQFLLSFEQGEAADYEQKSEQDDPGFRRKEKCADCDRAKNQ